MNAIDIHKNLEAKFGDAIGAWEADNPNPAIWVGASQIAHVGLFLRDETDLRFDFLESISGVDDSEKLIVVYHLFSYTYRHSLVLKIERPYDQLEVPTCCDVWSAANWHEREQFDLFGFQFTGHPDLRRLLLPEDWDGFPLRKDYQYPTEYHSIDHHRPDPKEQFKALDQLAAKAALRAKEQSAANAPPPSTPGQQ